MACAASAACGGLEDTKAFAALPTLQIVIACSVSKRCPKCISMQGLERGSHENQDDVFFNQQIQIKKTENVSTTSLTSGLVDNFCFFCFVVVVFLFFGFLEVWSDPD